MLGGSRFARLMKDIPYAEMMPCRPVRLAWAVVCLLVLCGSPLSAATLYWDSNGATPYAGGPTPTGTWGTDAFWSSSAQGTAATGAYVSASDVVFAAGADATGAYTVTLSGTQTASTVTFGEGHVILSGGTLALSGGSITTQMDSTISSSISAASGYSKNGVGTPTLTANYSGGAITVNSGTLILGAGITGDGFAPNPRSITINAGATFRYGVINPVQNATIFTINSGGTLDLNGLNDAVGNFAGSGLISLGSGTFTVDVGSTATFSGIITGAGGLSVRAANSGGGLLILAGANTYTGTTSLTSTTANAGGLQAANKRALRNSSVSLTNTTGSGLTFGSGIGTFILGGLSGSTGLSLTDAASTAVTLQVGNNNLSTSYTGVLSGSGGLTKIGTGTLTLTNANLYSGDTTINPGTANSTGANPANPSTLKLDFNAAGAPVNNILSTSSRLVLGGGQLQMAGSNSAAVSQTVNGLQVNAGFSQIGVTAGATVNNTALNLGAITRSAGGLVNFTLPTGTQSAVNGITTSTNANANGILGAWATIGNDWATVVSNGTNNNVAAYTGYTLQSGTVVANSSTTNLKIDNTSADPLTLGSTVVDVSTIQITDTAARSLNVATGQTLRVAADGGIWRIGGGSTLRFTIGASANTGVLTAGGADNIAGELLLNAGGGITVNSKITDNGTGAVTVVKTGTSDLFLNGTNTYSGGTVVVQGRVNANTAGALGTGTVTVQPGGQIFLGGTITLANNFVIAGTGWGETAGPGAIRMSNGGTLGTASSTITLAGDARIGGNSVTSSTIAGKITGDYALEFANGSGSTLASFTLTKRRGNDFGGTLNINGGFNNGLITVKLGASGVIPNGAGKGNDAHQPAERPRTTTPHLGTLNGFAGNDHHGLVSAGTAAQTVVTNSSASANAGAPRLVTPQMPQQRPSLPVSSRTAPAEISASPRSVWASKR